MDFEPLLNQSMPERELFQKVCLELQENFESHQNVWYFLKIEKGPAFKNDPAGDEHSHISWIKKFYSADDMTHFIFDTKYDRSSIMIKFENNTYTILGRGFWLTETYLVSSTTITPSREIKLNGLRELGEMIPKIILEKGFGEIQSPLTTKWRKSV